MKRWTIPTMIIVAGLLIFAFAPQLASLPTLFQLVLFSFLVGLMAVDIYVGWKNEGTPEPSQKGPLAAVPKLPRWSEIIGVSMVSAGISTTILTLLKAGIGWQYQTIDLIVFNVVISAIMFFSVQVVKRKSRAKPESEQGK